MHLICAPALELRSPASQMKLHTIAFVFAAAFLLSDNFASASKGHTIIVGGGHKKSCGGHCGGGGGGGVVVTGGGGKKGHTIIITGGKKKKEEHHGLLDEPPVFLVKKDKCKYVQVKVCPKKHHIKDYRLVSKKHW